MMGKMMRRTVIAGTGSYLPPTVLTNHDLAERIDTSDEWIVERTGIRRRHVAGDGETTASMATEAGRAALAAAGWEASSLDGIIVATTTPDWTFPAVATQVQAALDAGTGFAFDIQAVCSGFVYALATADAYMRAGMANRMLVIGAETFTRILDWEDRTTCVLFGDGAGAVAVEAGAGHGGSADRGILACRLHADGRLIDLLKTDGGPATTGSVGKVRMKGREVFRHAVQNLANVMEETLAEAGVSADDVDWVIPHQANKRILDGTARKLGIDPRRIVVTVDEHANTSAASVPLALDTAVRGGRIQRGDLLLLEAMGGGFTWGACLLRW